MLLFYNVKKAVANSDSLLYFLFLQCDPFQICINKDIYSAVKHSIHISGLLACTMILDHSIWLHYIRTDLITPSDICYFTTDTTSFPFLYSSIQRFATLKIRSLFATDVPPNFLTINIVLCFLHNKFTGKKRLNAFPFLLSSNVYDTRNPSIYQSFTRIFASTWLSI